ncbi:MAG: hypothetical protein KF861_10320 [Planctomycetaceae bacterium]|nr:hypothetical protein [Planctomycetaceae bacterium]
MSSQPIVFRAASACLLTLLAGCGGVSDGPDRHNISGKVTFDGAPVVDGMIVFEHAETKFKSACPISDGYYENESDKGHLGGKYTVTVQGNQAKSVAGMPPAPLWKGVWTKEVDLPAESTKMDFEITKAEVDAAPPAPTNPADQS